MEDHPSTTMEDDPEFHLSSYGNTRAYVSQLQSLRDAALDHPLVAGTAFTLVLRPVVSHAHGRPLPRFAARLPKVCEVVLERALQTGCDKRSQVWVACVRDSALPDEELGRIIVKIIQPSLLPHPDPSSFGQMDWVSPKGLACTEDWTYGELQSIQGREIPYYYGMQTVVVPSGETAWILAIEYVEGQTIPQWFNSTHEQDPYGNLVPKDLTPEMFDRLKMILVSSLESITAIHTLGVFHGDVSGRNMLLSATFPDGPRIVFVDLAQAVPLAALPRTGGDQLLEACVESSVCCGEHWDVVREWAEEGPLPGGLKFPAH
ncbi:hypothetical protein PLICRDRAFT_373417 [Plicaturopsis crispa FD-325 SS-3]|uniref:Uncharacterized protein n=1 Tax=Plicaturopsis crispa FD-325 SS-3 TaxID=944288 RepID=A0A0C9T4G4_PLICR|nr:hypothetical protein PLICRDRAFT_373417 [Plicaturopsis crispa FD-325 SS-3]